MIARIDESVNQLTLNTYDNYAYAWRNWLKDDVTYVPNPITGIESNCYIKFSATKAGSLTIDYGDGTVNTHDLIKSSNGDYVLAFKTLNVDCFKDPSAVDKGWTLGKDDNGNTIIPLANYKYSNLAERKIILTFSTDISLITSFGCRYNEFPLINMGGLEELTILYATDIKEIPIDRLTNLTNLKKLDLIRPGSKLQILPDSLFQLSKLEYLRLTGCVDMKNVDACNIRKVENLRSLNYLDVRGCDLPEYLSEFNNLIYLKNLFIGSGLDEIPSFENITEINNSLETLNFVWDAYGSGENVFSWGNIAGKGIDKLKECSMSGCYKITTTLPQYLKEMRSMERFSVPLSFRDQPRTDSFIDNLYAYITTDSNYPMSATAVDGLRNQFYNLKVVMYDPIYPHSSMPPTGTYQAPTGFVLGSANGTPSSPMEKLYVLTKNYKHTWIVNNQTLTRKIVPVGYYLDNSVIYSKDEPIINNEIKQIPNENNYN